LNSFPATDADAADAQMNEQQPQTTPHNRAFCSGKEAQVFFFLVFPFYWNSITITIVVINQSMKE
jgi:hypothetical protein